MFRAKRSRKNDARSKVVTYLRDIFCLPEHCEDRFGNVQIPRGTRRTALAKNDVGLLGKIEFKSDWSAEKMKREVCCVFAKPFGLTKEDIEEGRLFLFDYLQRTGAGSRSLCTPAVTESFEWNGRQVATLSKSGGYIYILARRALPVLASKPQMYFLEEESDDAPTSPLQEPPSSPTESPLPIPLDDPPSSPLPVIHLEE